MNEASQMFSRKIVKSFVRKKKKCLLIIFNQFFFPLKNDLRPFLVDQLEVFSSKEHKLTVVWIPLRYVVHTSAGMSSIWMPTFICHGQCVLKSFLAPGSTAKANFISIWVHTHQTILDELVLRFILYPRRGKLNPGPLQRPLQPLVNGPSGEPSVQSEFNFIKRV